MSRGGTILHWDEGELASRPEIARNSLTKLLLQNISSDIIRWNHKVLSVGSNRNPSTGASEIILDLVVNGTTVYDFVVGADGAWSRVRQMLSNIAPFSSDSLFVTATVRNVSIKYPHLLKVNGSGTLHALGNCSAIVS